MDRLTWQRTDRSNRLRFLDRPEHLRKLRLFSVACCRRVGRWLADPRSRRAVEVAELRADGQATDPEAREAAAHAWAAERAAGVVAFGARADPPASAAGRAALARAGAVAQAALAACYCLADSPQLAADHAVHAAATTVPRGVWGTLGWARAYRAACHEEGRAQKALLDEVFGDPFRPAAVDPLWLAWEGGVVPALAQGIYEERAFERLALLADALEEAGCTDAELLGHLRGPGPHTRGCWALDLFLGKQA
jgi:hypothetical protein